MSTVWPRCRSGAVGSNPALIRSGRLLLSFFDQFRLDQQLSSLPRLIKLQAVFNAFHDTPLKSRSADLAKSAKLPRNFGEPSH